MAMPSAVVPPSPRTGIPLLKRSRLSVAGMLGASSPLPSASATDISGPHTPRGFGFSSAGRVEEKAAGAGAAAASAAGGAGSGSVGDENAAAAAETESPLAAPPKKAKALSRIPLFATKNVQNNLNNASSPATGAAGDSGIGKGRPAAAPPSSTSDIIPRRVKPVV
jgi:hypothetical protein